MLKVLILVVFVALISLAGWLLYPAPALHGETRKVAAIPLDDGEIAVGWLDSEPLMAPKPWIARLDSRSKPLWQKTFGEEGDELRVIAPLPGGRFAAGSMHVGGYAPAWAIGFNVRGNVLWEQNFGEGTYSVSSIAALPDGNMLFAGGDSSGPESARWAALVSSGGKLIWRKAFDNEGNKGTAYAITPLGDGAIVAGQRWRACFCEGYHSGEPWAARLGKDGEVIWSKDFGPDMSFAAAAGRHSDYVLRSVAVAPDGIVILNGDGIVAMSSATSGPGTTHKVAAWQLRVDLDGNVTGKDYSAAADGR